MTIIQAALLGVLQGLTEFLPVSSSGHLVLGEYLFGLTIHQKDLLAFDVLLHAGTLLAILLCYGSVWWRILRAFIKREPAYQRLFFLLIIATVPGAIAGLLLEDVITAHLRAPVPIAFAFIITGVLLYWSERSRSNGNMTHLTPLKAAIIGMAQACALPPGLSRSGLTISAGRALGLSRTEAVDFSFLMAAPIIGGATVFVLIDVLRGDVTMLAPSIVTTGFLSSFFASMGAIVFLRRWVRRYSLSVFSLYLFIIAAILIATSFLMSLP